MSSPRKYPGIYVEERTDSKGRTAYRIKWKAGSPAKWQSVTVWKAGERDAATRELDRIGANILSDDVRVTSGALWLGDEVLPVAASMTFAQAAEAAIANRVNAKPTTLARYRAEVVGADRLGRWADRDLRGIKHAEVVAWIGTMKARGNAPATVAARLHVMRLTFRHALTEGWITRNPLATVPRNPEAASLTATQKRAEMHLLSAEDVAAIIDATEHPRIKVLWQVLAMTGMRIGEALGLQVGAVDLNGASPSIRVVQALSQNGKHIVAPKTAKSVRAITLDTETVEALRPLVAGAGPDDYVWHLSNGEPIGYDAARRRWVESVKAAGIPSSARMHDLRHAHATWLLSTGTVAITAVSKRLGHGSIKITADTYAHVDPHAEQTVLDALASVGLRSQPTSLAARRKRAAVSA